MNPQLYLEADGRKTLCSSRSVLMGHLWLTMLLCVPVPAFAQTRPAAPKNFRIVSAAPSYRTSGRYLVDQNNAPVLLVGDAPHAMFTNLSVSDATAYMADRAAHGINILWVEIVNNNAVGGRSDGSTYDGIRPFTATVDGTHYNLTAPNEAYFARIDQVISIAATYGLVILLDTMEEDGWLTTFEANGSGNATAWGRYLGNRYKNAPNVVWITGNDFQTWNTSPGDNALAQAVMSGIAQTDPNHFQTTELNYNLSGSLDDSLLAPLTALAGAYTYYPTYYKVLEQYNSSVKTVPVFMQEGYYEGFIYGNLTPQTGTDLMLRRQAYWTVLAGGLAGYMYGSSFYDFHSGWQTGIDTTAVTELGYWKNLFTSLAWYNLVPDQTHSVVTAGYGTATGNGTGNIQTDNYVTTAAPADGSLLVAYCPTSTSLTVDMTKMRGSSTARWYDPTNGTFQTIAGSPFANIGVRTFTTPGSNTAGDPDWVLVLQ